ncbi:MAG: hypothetical protein AB1586_13615 [Pseudomonadota bacterium]
MRAWRETAKALIAQRRPAICWTSNADGGSTSHNTLNRALRIMEGAFEGDVMEETAAERLERHQDGKK